MAETPLAYTWNVDELMMQRSATDFSIPGYTAPQKLNCEAKYPASGETVSVSKTVQVEGRVLCDARLLL